MIVKVKGDKKGGHVHATIFMGMHEGALGNCGDIVMRTEEYGLFFCALKMGASRMNGHLAVKIEDNLEDGGAT